METLTKETTKIKGWGVDADPRNEPTYPGGLLRKLAFRYSESSFGHWLPLIFADRINIWKGFLSDFKRGLIPNIFAERGLRTELKYNNKQFLARSAVKVLAVAFVVSWILTSSRKRKRKRNR